MSYNQILKEETIVQNHEGAEAYKLTPEMELYTAVCTMALQPKFYETSKEQIDRIANLVRQVDATFVAKLAVYARKEMNLRSVPMLLIVELAKIHSGDDLICRTIDNVIMRADEIMELLMCYQWRNPQPGVKKLAKLSHQIQNGLQKAFNKFDEYQFAKYDRDNLEVKLRDALFIVHPKAKDEAQQVLFDKIVNKRLETPYTWETELSALGQVHYDDADAKKQAFRDKWTELVASGKLGYMALLRNLRNILESDVEADMISSVAERLANPHEVLRSKQFPFRYLSAYRELKSSKNGNVQDVLDALENAVLSTSQNITGFDKNTRVLLACDVSGSMYSPISARSSVKNYDIGLVLAMLLKNRCENVVSGIFGNTWKVVNMPSTGILSNVELMYKREGEVGYSTNGYKVIEYLITNNVKMDKVMMFTDCQMWDSYGSNTMQASWQKYKELFPKAKLYLFDLCGYGQLPVRLVDNDILLIAGWSDKIFDMLFAIENGSGVIEEIKKTEL